jgi:integrase
MEKTLTLPKHEIQTLAQLTETASDYARHSKSENTIRAYRSDWKHFSEWCESRGFIPLPASSTVLALYLTAYAQLLKVATLSRHLAAISEAHRTAGLESPNGSKEVEMIWRGIRRTHGTKQEQKLPILTDDLRKAFASYRHDLKGCRDHAILLLGFTGAFRRSELVALDLCDLQFVPEGITVEVRHSKTDQESAGQIKAIPFSSALELCPVRAIQEWLRVSGIVEGALFRSLGKGNHLLATRLSGRAVALIVKGLKMSKAATPITTPGIL